MFNVSSLLGVKEILENPASLEALKNEIMNDVRYVTPGYGCDYYLRTYDDGIEFEWCKGVDGSDRGIAVHFSGNQMMTLTLNQIVSEKDSFHIYNMCCGNRENSFDVRIVCPDVLAFPRPGDRIYGQIQAFSNGNISISDTVDEMSGRSFVKDIGSGSVMVAGRISDIDEHSFLFEDISREYYEITIETGIGKIPVVVMKDVISEPEIGQHLCSEAVLSFDVAIAPKAYDEGLFARELYKNAPFAPEYRLGQGFIPNLGNAEKTLLRCIESGGYSRFSRTCAEKVTFHINGVDMMVSNEDLAGKLEPVIPSGIAECEIKHIVTCKSPHLLGWDAVAIEFGENTSAVIVLGVNKYGFVDEITFVAPDSCELGYDYELHAMAMLSYGMSSTKVEMLLEFLADDCYYHSEYADCTYTSRKKIIDHLNDVADALDETNQYSHEIIPASDALRTKEDLPKIYNTNWCSVVYQGKELAYIVFLRRNESGEISSILLSRNGNYLKAFETAGSSVPLAGAEPVNVKDLLEDFYGHEDPLGTMRNCNSNDEDALGAYVWREADAFSRSWLQEQGYTVTETELEDDCIGYACTRKGKDSAVFVYAYGKQKTVMLDAEYCQRLKAYPLSMNRQIIIVYLHVESKVGDNGEKQYRVGRYSNSEKTPEKWILKEVNGKDIILYYPCVEIYAMINRLMAAFNTQNLDVLKAICTSDVGLEDPEGGCTLNDGFYSNLSHIYKEHGKMKTAYVRYNDVVYSAVPYIDGYCYFSFSVTNDTNQICRITESPLDESYRELLITDECPESDPLNEYPLLREVEFLPASDVARFSARLVFENGEIRRYNFKAAPPLIVSEDAPEETVPDQEEVSMIGRTCFTDKIFRHGRIVDHIDLPEWMGYYDYPLRGQGLVFVNGYTISTAELYFNSYPIEEFSYAGMDGVSVSQFDYDEDGFGVGRISNLNPENPYYLLNKNTMTAKTIPAKYQKTPMMISPFCGGYSEGLIMVSTLDDIALQYHHNRMGCAGMWGWLDKDLKEVIEPQYIFAINFVNSRAVVCRGEWSIDDNNRYWCKHEQWGVIDTTGKEIVPCAFDELYEIGNTDRLYFVHTGGWENGHCAVFDVKEQRIILELDFDYDPGYMFNECFVAENDILVFDVHLPGEGKDLITAYDLHGHKYLLHQEENTERTFNGQKTLTVKNEDTGMDITVF